MFDFKKVLITTMGLLLLIGCSVGTAPENEPVQESVQPQDSEQSSIDTEDPAKLLGGLASKSFTLEGSSISEEDGDLRIEFARCFVDLAHGSAALNEPVSYDHYIANANLLSYTERRAPLLMHVSSLLEFPYGLNNRVHTFEIDTISDTSASVTITFKAEKPDNFFTYHMLVVADNGTLKLADYYMWNKDGVDQIAIGYRDIEEIGQWDDAEWVDGVFEKLSELETEYLS